MQAPAPQPPPPPPTRSGVVQAIASTPIDGLANFASAQQHTPQEMIRIVRRLTAFVRHLSDLLRHNPITDADIRAVEKKARRGGDHEGREIDEFLRHLPPTSDQPRLRAMLERERSSAAKQIASMHIAADRKGVDLAGLISSGARRT